MGEIVIPNHCHPLVGKIEGTRSTPVTKKTTPLAYFTTTIQIRSHANNNKKVRYVV
jgi:hypothetical protein